MKRDYKKSAYTFLGVLHFFFIVVLLAYFAVSLGLDSLPESSDTRILQELAIVAALVISSSIFLLPLRTQLMLRSRSRHFMKYAINNAWSYGQSGSGAAVIGQISSSSLSLLPAGGGVKYSNILAAEGEYYVDYEYGIYTKTKYYTYKSRRVFYAVYSVRLPRELPNVLFDAKSSHKNQFKVKFDQNQRHSLEGNFDTYFETYFPNEYTIDSLSFITPEVMQSLISAANYDVEINGKQLLLYAPIALDGPGQLNDMQKSAHEIRQTLLNNILTYRDDRLPRAEGRTGVATLGRYLETRREPLWPFIVALVVGFAYVLFFVMPNR